MELRNLVGHDLGSRTVSYDEADAILYALAVGAPPERTDLVYERDLRVLPSYGCAMGLWAVEACGETGAYDRHRSLHASQALSVHQPLPASGAIEMRGRVAAVWDKGKASMVEIVAESDFFDATYSIFLPGVGDWGGERGPSSEKQDIGAPNWESHFQTQNNLAAIYRLTGDFHPIHIDPEVAKANSFNRPILHGLCTLGIAARLVAEAVDAHPCELVSLSARLAAPVMPGDQIDILASPDGNSVNFEARVGETGVLKAGQAVFG